MAKRATTRKRTIKRKSAKKASPRRAAAKGPAAKTRRTPAVAKRKTAARAAATRKKPKKAPRKPSRLAAAATLAKGAAATAAAAVARRLPWAKDENDPVVLLEADHRRFEDLLTRGEETTARAVKTRGELLQTLSRELNVHELIEEKVFYPALKPHAEARDIVLEGYQEHHVADVIISELKDLAKDDEKWGAKFKVLKESVEHHIDEEENKMFPIARAVFSREELSELGAQMRKLRAEQGD